MTSWFCLSQGRAELAVALPDQTCAVGEGVAMIVDANNHTKAKFKGLEVGPCQRLQSLPLPGLSQRAMGVFRDWPLIDLCAELNLRCCCCRCGWCSGCGWRARRRAAMAAGTASATRAGPSRRRTGKASRPTRSLARGEDGGWGGGGAWSGARAAPAVVCSAEPLPLAPPPCRCVTLPLPPGMLLSVQGAHFRVAFELEVVLKSGVMVSDVKLRVRSPS